MKVLFLSNNWTVAEPLAQWIDKRAFVELREHAFPRQDSRGVDADLIVSYCYRHKVPGWVLKQMPGVNLHNGYLPWGRGVQPLFFGVLYKEPLGVSIHWMTDKIDGGEVIAHQFTDVTPDMTFREAYDMQHRVLRDLFKTRWPSIAGMVGAYHSMADFEREKHRLTHGWDTKIGEVWQ